MRLVKMPLFAYFSAVADQRMRTLDNDTAAAIPAQLRLTREGYARYFAKSAVQKAMLLGSAFVPYEGRGLLAFLRPGVPHWLEVKEHLAHGCLCPSEIIDRRAGLLATFASLNAVGERSLPVVKIRREPLHLLPKPLQHDGARLASAGIFHATPQSWEEGYWVDFTPLPVDCLIDDEGACQSARGRLLPLAWEALRLALAELDGKKAPGLYGVDVPHEIVWNAF